VAGSDDVDFRRQFPMTVPDFSKEPKPLRPSWVPRERHRWVWDNLTAGRINPLGAINRFRTGYRLQLSNRPGILFERSFAAIKAAADLTPAYAKLGGVIELQPLAILNLSARYDFIGNFGMFDQVQSFETPAVDFSDTALGEGSDNYATTGEAATLSALFQIKLGAIAIRNKLRAHMQRMDLEDGERFFYNSTLDVLHPNGGWALTDDVDLLYVTNFGLKLGARYTFTKVLYDDEHETAAEANDATPSHRVGPAVAYTFFNDPAPARFASSTIAFVGQWWAKHPYRTGKDTSAAIPYMLLVFIQKGDLAP